MVAIVEAKPAGPRADAADISREGVGGASEVVAGAADREVTGGTDGRADGAVDLIVLGVGEIARDGDGDIEVVVRETPMDELELVEPAAVGSVDSVGAEQATSTAAATAAIGTSNAVRRADR
jgi:hypothetical protein